MTDSGRRDRCRRSDTDDRLGTVWGARSHMGMRRGSGGLLVGVLCVPRWSPAGRGGGKGTPLTERQLHLEVSDWGDLQGGRLIGSTT
ncbi:hypothetical protein NDU88_005872 [Pleurodeles waltl]|uniref:Uncharacterized protein n=1 Tax=Pleurodeles waltl TaxID=8319 RepID=A0AAV7TBU0_PLEWA|nr:hypothetical protein NDU88_005872 [Pleurodeles waltl]